MDGTCGTNGGWQEVLTRLWYGELRERSHFEDVDGGKIILKWMLKKHVVRTWTNLSGKRNGQAVGFFDHGNKPSF